jgi:hypothetical protein
MRASIIIIVLLAAAPLARADETVHGTLRLAPPRLERGYATTALTGALASALAGCDGRTVDAVLRGTELVSIQATLSTDAALVDSPDGGRSVARLAANAPVSVVGARGSSLQVAAPTARGWIAASLVSIGTPSVTGRAIGRVVAPVLGETSSLRSARTFHPDGTVYRGTVRSLSPATPFDVEAKRLEGAALMRVGVGVWKRGMPALLEKTLPDAPSIAIRFRSKNAPVDVQARAGDQDLLCLSWAQRFRSIPLAVFFADKHDYFDNAYFADQPFRIEGTSLDVWVRLVPIDPAPAKRPTDAAGREAKLLDASKVGRAAVRIEVQEVDPSWSREWLGVNVSDLIAKRDWLYARREQPWVPLALLTFDEKVDVDQEALHFSPDLAGRGLIPTGPIAAARGRVYATSQASRPQTAEARQAADSQGFLHKLVGR